MAQEERGAWHTALASEFCGAWHTALASEFCGAWHTALASEFCANLVVKKMMAQCKQTPGPLSSELNRVSDSALKQLQGNEGSSSGCRSDAPKMEQLASISAHVPKTYCTKHCKMNRFTELSLVKLVTKEKNANFDYLEDYAIPTASQQPVHCKDRNAT